MLFEDNKILEFDQYQKADKAAFIIYAYLECVWQKGLMDVKINLKIKKKVSEHIPSGFSMSTIPLFRSIENKYDAYRGKAWMKRFSEFIREQPMKIINFENKKMELLTKELQESYEN